MKICIACGMPMNEPADYAMEDPSKDCRFTQLYQALSSGSKLRKLINYI
jgi:hypothetical protein